MSALAGILMFGEASPVATPVLTTDAAELSLPRVPWEGGASYYRQFPDADAYGWSDPTFFPIGVWWAVFSSDEEVQWDKSLGINTYIVSNPDSDYGLIERHGMSWIGGQLPGTTRSSKAWVGDFLDDEVDGRYKPKEGFSALISIVNKLPDHNKIRYANFTSNIVSWLGKTDSETYVNQFTDTISIDSYWYTISQCDWEKNWGDALLVSIPKETCRTSSSYGKVVKSLRARDAVDGKLQPIWNFVEDVYGMPEKGFLYKISDGQIKGAAMNSIINEARGIVWFNSSFRGPCAGGNAIRVAQDHPDWPCAAGIRAMGEVNNQIKRLAPILNTQSFEWQFGPNLETMLKAKDGFLYIFAMTDGTSGIRSFVLPPDISGHSAEVVDEGRAIEINDGKYIDSFEFEYTYHIYKIKI